MIKHLRYMNTFGCYIPPERFSTSTKLTSQKPVLTNRAIMMSTCSARRRWSYRRMSSSSRSTFFWDPRKRWRRKGEKKEKKVNALKTISLGWRLKKNYFCVWNNNGKELNLQVPWTKQTKNRQQLPTSKARSYSFFSQMVQSHFMRQIGNIFIKWKNY